MSTDHTPDPQEVESQAAQEQDFFSRVDTRIDTKGIRCDFDSKHARVMDLTGQGMRITVPVSNLPEINETKPYTFTDSETEHSLTVEGIVRWVRKGSVLTRKAEVGIEFVDLPAAHRDALTRLAVQGELVLSSDPVEDEGNDIPSSNDEMTLQPQIDLYDILDVSRYASEEAITLAFRKLVKQWHPDRNDDPQAPARFEELHKAYSILRDPELRDRYDQRFGPDQAAA